MPSFTNQITNMKHIGPICNIKIGLSSIATEVLTSKGESIPAPIDATALIDTGASGTCIKPEIVKALGLIPRGVVQIATPSTQAHPCNVFDISLHFPIEIVVVGQRRVRAV